MSVSLKQRAALAAGLCCLLAGIVVAQQVVPGQSDRATRPRPGESQQFGAAQRTTAQGANAEVDRYLANCWAGNNKAEIEISQLAEQRSENPQVKEFAQMLVRDHSELAPKLEALASGRSGEFGRQSRTTETEVGVQATTQRESANDASRQQSPGAASGQIGTRTDSRVGQSTTGDSAGDGQAINRLIAIDKQIGERCLQEKRQKLEEKSGAEFDQCYVGGQIMSHMQSSAALEVISQQTSGELKQLASQAKQTVDHHLQQAEQLAEQLKGQSQEGGQQARATRDRNVRPAGAQR